MSDKPKRPLSAYMIWLNENRESIKAENPGAKVTEVAKRGGELWRELKDKTVWDQKAVEAKERYVKLVKEFEANGGSKDAAPAAKKRGKAAAAKKPAPKKSKKKAESDDDESGGDESD